LEARRTTFETSVRGRARGRNKGIKKPKRKKAAKGGICTNNQRGHGQGGDGTAKKKIPVNKRDTHWSPAPKRSEGVQKEKHETIGQNPVGGWGGWVLLAFWLWGVWV